MTLNLAETSGVKSRPSVPYGAIFVLFWHVEHITQKFNTVVSILSCEDVVLLMFISDCYAILMEQ